MLLSELNIAAEDFPEARRALGDLVETDPNRAGVTLRAAIEAVRAGTTARPRLAHAGADRSARAAMDLRQRSQHPTQRLGARLPETARASTP